MEKNMKLKKTLWSIAPKETVDVHVKWIHNEILDVDGNLCTEQFTDHEVGLDREEWTNYVLLMAESGWVQAYGWIKVHKEPTQTIQVDFKTYTFNSKDIKPNK